MGCLGYLPCPRIRDLVVVWCLSADRLSTARGAQHRKLLQHIFLDRRNRANGHLRPRFNLAPHPSSSAVACRPEGDRRRDSCKRWAAKGLYQAGMFRAPAATVHQLGCYIGYVQRVVHHWTFAPAGLVYFTVCRACRTIEPSCRHIWCHLVGVRHIRHHATAAVPSQAGARTGSAMFCLTPACKRKARAFFV